MIKEHNLSDNDLEGDMFQETDEELKDKLNRLFNDDGDDKGSEPMQQPPTAIHIDE